eukprot:CAMPEP_0117437396 /NCGR_PEP_ID=MMETSP0759-20121206/1501_1 /TAXON_ID=63605 /ORGANISM="Percolomonas cosmopolitus, Strain WS" /LENGTH=352 /DNA_ID=CAMNT_0005229025 /DNA_START=48 /DNA_END=1106 /DNA_ORIENTATION=+
MTPVQPSLASAPTADTIHDQVSSLYSCDRLFEAYDMLMNVGPKHIPDFNPKEHQHYSDIISSYNFSYPLLHILRKPPLDHFSSLCHDKDGIQVRYYDGTTSPRATDDDTVPKEVRSFFQQQDNAKVQSMWIKGTIEADFLLLIAVLYEIDLYSLWVPSLSSSHLLKETTNFHVFCEFHWNLSWPLSDRKLWTEGIGIDRLSKHGEVLVAIRDFPPDKDDELKEITTEFMKKNYPKGDHAVEMRCPYAAFLLRAISPTQTELTIVSTVNPQIQFVPSWLRNMATKTASPMVIHKIREIVRKTEQDEKYKEYLKRIQETKKDVYDDIRDRLNGYWESTDKKSKSQELQEQSVTD